MNHLNGAQLGLIYMKPRRETRENVWPEVHFSGSENVTEFLEGIDLFERSSPRESPRLVPNIRIRDYVEVRNPQNAIQLLEVLAKFEERYSCKATRNSRNSDNVKGRGWNERRMSNVGNNRGNWRNSEVVRRTNNGRND
ncbi:uncharacterized protein TNCV_1345061 [Trichonephila clavipes]|nr:uncharacterized protein TNCV_1345061 [Trichonephila clavipes]